MFQKVLFVTVMILGVCKAEEGGFSPTGRYYESELPYQKYKNNKTYVPHNPVGADKKESRFGALTYNPSGNGYGMTYNTMKLDLNGVVLGALIGLGAIMILPKVAQIFGGGGHEGYGRNLEEEMSTVTNLLSKIDNSLAVNSIDSTACTQRIVCNTVRDAVKNAKTGEATSVDEFVLSFTRNPLFTYATPTAIKEAVETGHAEDSDRCTTTYSDKCPLNKDNVLKVMSSLIPFN